jgi:hypothetical protein
MLRDRYIHVLLGEMKAEVLIGETAGKRLGAEQIRRVHMLLEAQRERQRMFTSCGWFFDDFDRIEPKNNLAYAAQATHLTYQATSVDLTSAATERLRRVASHRSELRGDQVFNRHMQRAKHEL